VLSKAWLEMKWAYILKSLIFEDQYLDKVVSNNLIIHPHNIVV
jgi:hypothetical protein